MGAYICIEDITYRDWTCQWQKLSHQNTLGQNLTAKKFPANKSYPCTESSSGPNVPADVTSWQVKQINPEHIGTKCFRSLCIRTGCICTDTSRRTKQICPIWRISGQTYQKIYFPTMCRNQKVVRVSGPKVGMCRRNLALSEKKSGPKRIRIERVVIKTYRDYSIGTKLNRVKKKSAINNFKISVLAGDVWKSQSMYTCLRGGPAASLHYTVSLVQWVNRLLPA